MTKLEFKTEKQRTEFQSGNLDEKVLHLINLVQVFISIEYPDYRHITLTEVFRTQEENNELYGDEKHFSTHTFWRATDIRCNDMPEGMPEKLEKLLNLVTYEEGRKIVTCKLHNITDNPAAKHLHLQVSA